MGALLKFLIRHSFCFSLVFSLQSQNLDHGDIIQKLEVHINNQFIKAIIF